VPQNQTASTRQCSDCEKSEMVVGRCESVTAWPQEDKRARLLGV